VRDVQVIDRSFVPDDVKLTEVVPPDRDHVLGRASDAPTARGEK
jgi:hypothetical protein